LPSTVLTFVVAAPALPESARPLLGQWTCIARTYNGRAGDLDPCGWEFAAGGKLLSRRDGYEPAEWRYTAAPAHLDWVAGEEEVRAIYRLDGDTLTVCYSHRAPDRPTRFDSPTGAHLVLLTFKRAKPAERSVRAGTVSARVSG
jgi:uncharacterized protein (TIGR03067 family)